jgi:D-alanyl-D-alanine carboxypeptidase/D-alanyl-D-alanine-endopeptidase (penicillin-binding protein 4)
VADVPTGTLLATHRSEPLKEMMQAMLRFSTNITAEAAGLSATAAQTGQMRGLRTSAFGMARWAERRAGGITPHFVDHSGLGDLSRVSASDMVRMLMADGVRSTLQPIMRQINLVDNNNKQIEDARLSIRAKTGTLNFVSSLAGYVQTAQGRDLAFAIFSSDLEARAQGKLQGDESPPGARSWNRRARGLQQDILKHLALRLI